MDFSEYLIENRLLDVDFDEQELGTVDILQQLPELRYFTNNDEDEQEMER